MRLESAALTLRSAFNGPPARIADPDADHFDSGAAGAGDDLGPFRRQPSPLRGRRSRTIESVREDEQLFDDAARHANEEIQCTALLRAEV